MKKTIILTVLALVGAGIAAQATPVTFSFLENGANVNLGSTSTFTQGGDTLTAYASPGQQLYAKSTGGGEIGLGIASDPAGQHEIYGSTFVQLLGTSSELITSLFTENNNDQDLAFIYASTTLGTLGTLLTPIAVNGPFVIPTAYQDGFYIGIANGYPGGNTWVGATVVNTVSTVPDGGSTVLLLGSVLTGIGLIKRKLMA
jgi:hypothetical protein